jgi:hypothetical protein
VNRPIKNVRSGKTDALVVLYYARALLVKGQVKPGKKSALVRAIDDGTLGQGSITG